jgi:hypothetical protein
MTVFIFFIFDSQSKIIRLKILMKSYYRKIDQQICNFEGIYNPRICHPMIKEIMYSTIQTKSVLLDTFF